MKSHSVSERDIEDVWTAIALHTTPGIPEHMRPTIALVTAGVEMDVLGIAYHDFTHEERDHVCAHHPREANFKEDIIDHLARGIARKQLNNYGNVKAEQQEERRVGKVCGRTRGTRVGTEKSKIKKDK